MKIGIWVICSGCQEAFLQERAKYVPNKVNRYCNKSCRIKYSNTLRMKKQDPVADFWSFVVKDDSNHDACWSWSGQKISGYGVFYKQGIKKGEGSQSFEAHRFSYELHKGPIPFGDVIRHLCPGGGNRDCSNPKHLATGSHRENAQDRVDQGRSPVGTSNGRARITEKTAKKIKHLLATTKLSIRDIARACQTTKDIVGAISAGKTWKHLD